jgi:site-specific recombinase XerD
MNKVMDKKLFFSMTMDFLNVYIPQDSPSEKTVKTYRDGLTVFRRYVCDERQLSIRKFRFDDCTFDFVLDYRNWLLDVKHRARSTVNNRLAAIKSYVRYASAKDVSLQQVFINVSEVPFLRVEKKIRPILDDTESLRAFLDAPPNTRTGCRDTMILSVLFDTMIRADELIQINISDVCLNSEIPYILIHGKGSKERTVSLSEKVVPLIRAYIDEFHGTSIKNQNSPFVYTVSHNEVHRMSERNVERIVKKYADITRKNYPDLPDPVYPHMLRRTRGTGLYRDGVPIEVIAVAMGHANVQTTKDHYAFPSLEQNRATMEKGTGVIASGNEKPEWPDSEEELARLCGLR